MALCVRLLEVWPGSEVTCAVTGLGLLKDPGCVPVSAAVTAMPAIAVVDSGIDASRLDFAGRVRAEVNLASLARISPGDGRGHGTFVAASRPARSPALPAPPRLRRSSRSTSRTTPGRRS
jgi:hypothetical protein